MRLPLIHVCRRREPPLPQIPRSFLRVRDGRMTVRVVMRYLVNKLSLEDDSQVCHAYLAPCLFYFILFLHSFALSLCFFFMFVFFE
jgi:hypothetical protein